MTFSVNTSPFAGQDGTYVTSRNLRERLFKETYSDVSLKVEETDSPDAFVVSGRGELHLSILIENMRREGYEFQVSKPRVIYETIGGRLHEPIERVLVDVPDLYMGTVIEKLGRKGEIIRIGESRRPCKVGILCTGSRTFGYRSEFLTDTRVREY